MSSIIEFEVSNKLKQYGVTGFGREGSTLLLVYEGKSIIFNIQKEGLFKTIIEFEKASKDKIDRQTQQAIIFQLSSDKYYRKVLEDDYNNHKEEEQQENDQHDNTPMTTETDKSEAMEDETARRTIYSVSDAMRRHSGRIAVVGMVVSVSDLYRLLTKAVWKCDVCGKQTEKKIKKTTEPPAKPKECPHCDYPDNFEELHCYINAITLQIQDDVPQTGLDTLQVIVFDNDTEEIHVGENVKIIGKIEKVQDKRSRRYHSVLLAESIEYEHRKKLILTHNDIESIKRFAGKQPVCFKDGIMASLIHHKYRLVKMFAPNVIRHEDKKLALLLSLIGAPETNGIRGRIHELLIGPPGLGKTKLGRELIGARRNSRYVSGKNTTGKSLTGMVLKEEESYILNLGPVPLAKGAVCVINEFDKMNPEEQDNLLDVMEEGEFTVNKFAKLRTIRSPTTIIATANPKNNRWKDRDSISLDEIPFEAIILSRFDIVLVFRDTTEEQANREFAYKKIEYDERHIHHNYNFLEKYIEYARTINLVIITEEARSILNEYWITLKRKEEFACTNRTLESIYRISKAFARLHLCNRVDTKIAYETIDFMNNMLKDFEISIHQMNDPRSIAYDETIKVIQQQKVPIDLIEAIRMVCQKNDQVKHYIGNEFKQSRNKKLKILCNKIIENKSIVRTQHNPTVVQWTDGKTSNNQNNRLRDLSDLSDPHFRGLQLQNNGNSSGDEEENTNLDSNACINDDNSVIAAKDNSRSQRSQGSLQHNGWEQEDKKKEQILGPDKQSGYINLSNEFKDYGE
jgi:DNA replicative helicase MCM subunit Mcm2 (Cdc46/Mcm family)